MLELYYQPISLNSRRVWIALLEKEIDFELVEMQLDGDQFKPEFLALNPFHHIPVLVDDDFKLVESLAILDYLEAKYPTPSLLPNEAKAVGTTRMVEMVTVNELAPAMNPLVYQMMELSTPQPEEIELAKQKIATVVNFFEQLLGNNLFIAGEQLTLGDIVAGCAVPVLPILGVSLAEYPKINAWIERLNQRHSWQVTQPTPEAIEAYKGRIQALMAKNTSR